MSKGRLFLLQRTRLVYLALLLLIPIPLTAFEDYEHKRLSNAALAAARDYAEATPCIPPCRDLTESDLALLKSLISGRDGLRSYGHFVSLTDFVTRPFDAFWKDGVPAYDREFVDWAEVERLKRSKLDYLFATKYDEHHFGREALFEFWFWHEAAVAVASRGDLFEAFVLNSFADHLMQDFLAPGHFVAPKDIAHDAIVKALHDKYNHEGLPFHIISSSAQRDLGPLAVFLRTDASPQFQAICHPWSIGDYAAILSKPQIPSMKGDAHLAFNGDQIALMILLTMRSDLDVIETYRFRERKRAPGAANDGQNDHSLGINHFRWRFWRYIDLPTDERKSAHRTSRELAVSAAEDSDLPEACRLQGGVVGCLPYGCYCGSASADSRISALPMFAPALGSLALTVAGRFEVRWRFDLDLLALYAPAIRNPPAPDEARHKGLGAAQVLIGGTYHWNNDLNAYGLRLRALFPVPRVPLQVVVGGDAKIFNSRGSRFDYRVANLVRYGYDLRLEAGFGVLFFGIGGTYDYRLVDTGRLSSAWGVSTAVSVQLPFSIFAEPLRRESKIPQTRSKEQAGPASAD